MYWGYLKEKSGCGSVLRSSYRGPRFSPRTHLLQWFTPALQSSSKGFDISGLHRHLYLHYTHKPTYRQAGIHIIFFLKKMFLKEMKITENVAIPFFALSHKQTGFSLVSCSEKPRSVTILNLFFSEPFSTEENEVQVRCRVCLRTIYAFMGIICPISIHRHLQ